MALPNVAARTAALAIAAIVLSGPVLAQTLPATRNVVLVHGAWVDGSSWQKVYQILTDRGFAVSIVQNPLTSFADDVAATRRVIALQDGPVVLVGHSYGGSIITEAGTDPNVSALVFVAAFAPDVGQSALDQVPKGAPPLPVIPSADGFLFFDKAMFHLGFAADLTAAQSDFLATTQVPFSLNSFGGKVTVAAWASKPSWYLIPTEDRAIAPELQQMMAKRAGSTVVTIAGSHAVYISQPEAVADLIEKAANGVSN